MKNELYHHGIDGQRWGVTHGPPYPLSRAEHRAVVKSKKSAEKRNLSWRSSRKHAHRMSDEDLNSTIDRLKREETYRQLVSKDKVSKRLAKEQKKTAKEIKKINENNNKKDNSVVKDKNQNKQSGIIRKSVGEAIGGGIKTMGNAGFQALAKAIWPDEKKENKPKTKITKDKDGNITFIVDSGDNNMETADAARAANMLTEMLRSNVNQINYKPDDIDKLSRNDIWDKPVNYDPDSDYY